MRIQVLLHVLSLLLRGYSYKMSQKSQTSQILVCQRSFSGGWCRFGRRVEAGLVTPSAPHAKCPLITDFRHGSSVSGEGNKPTAQDLWGQSHTKVLCEPPPVHHRHVQETHTGCVLHHSLLSALHFVFTIFLGGVRIYNPKLQYPGNFPEVSIGEYRPQLIAFEWYFYVYFHLFLYKSCKLSPSEHSGFLKSL